MKLLTTTVFIILSTALFAQIRSTSVGLRAGGVSGISVKYIDDDLRGVEVIAGAQENGFRLVGLVQKYTPIATSRLSNFYMFTGFGAHSGYIRYHETHAKTVEDQLYFSNYYKATPIFGGDFIVGVEYHFETIPLLFSVDYKPYFQLFGEHKFRMDLWDLGFTFRYAFNN